MLLLMFESSRRGYLQQANGTPTSPEQLSRMTGCDRDEAAHLLQELDDAGVFSRTDNGVIYSRRMTRDERKRTLCSEAGKRGGGNPTFKGPDKGSDKGKTQRSPKASSSTSSSSSKPSAGEPEAGSLHVRCRDIVHAYWQRLHPGDEVAPWDGFAGKKLALFLIANPRLTESGFKRLVDFRASSEVNHSEHPVDWMAKLTKFGTGPLDRYGKPLVAPAAVTSGLKFQDPQEYAR